MRSDDPKAWLKNAATAASDWDGNRYHFQSENAFINDLFRNGLLEVLEWYDDVNAGTEFNEDFRMSIKQREFAYV